MMKTLSFCAAAACLLSACAGQPQTRSDDVAAEDSYVPTGTHIPRKASSISAASVTSVDPQALDNGRNNHTEPSNMGR
jgi:hypothetical protein